MTNAAGKGPASSPGQASRAWPGAGTCAKLAQGDFARGTTRSWQVVPGLARLPAPTGPLPPSPCPTCAHPAWVTEGRPPGLWSGSWVQPAPALGEPRPALAPQHTAASSHPPLSLHSGGQQDHPAQPPPKLPQLLPAAPDQGQHQPRADPPPVGKLSRAGSSLL